MLIRNRSFPFDGTFEDVLVRDPMVSEKSNSEVFETKERGWVAGRSIRRGMGTLGAGLRGLGFLGAEIGLSSGFRRVLKGSLVLLCMLFLDRFACNAFQGSCVSDIVKPRFTA